MKGNFTAVDAEKLMYTMEITMSLHDWIELDKALTNKWPAGDLSRLIYDMTNQAKKIYFPKGDNS